MKERIKIINIKVEHSNILEALEKVSIDSIRTLFPNIERVDISQDHFLYNVTDPHMNQNIFEGNNIIAYFIKNKEIKAFKMKHFVFKSDATDSYQIINNEENKEEERNYSQLIKINYEDFIIMKELASIEDTDLASIEHQIKSFRFNQEDESNYYFISIKNIDVVHGLDNILILNTYHTKEFHLSINTSEDSEKIVNIIKKLSLSPTADVYIELILEGSKRTKSLEIASKLFKSLKITNLKLCYTHKYLKSICLKSKQKLLDEIVNIKGLKDFKYVDNSFKISNPPTNGRYLPYKTSTSISYFVGNLHYNRLNQLKDILSKVVTRTSSKQLKTSFLDFMILS